MSNTGPTQEQVDIANAFNAALQESVKLFDKIAEKAAGASENMRKMTEDLGKYNDQQKTQSDQTEKLNEALDEKIEKDEEQISLQELLGKKIKDLLKIENKQLDMVAMLTIGISGLQNGLEATAATFNLFGSVAKASFSVVQGALGMVSGIFGAFYKQAAAFYEQYAKAMFEANESIRDQFGDTAGTTGAFVKSMAADLNTASSALGSAGASLYNVLGDGPAKLQYVTELASAFGGQLVRLKDQVDGAAGAMLLMNRGMGISQDTFKVLAANAEASGTTLADTLSDVAVASTHMANKFGIDVKQIGKNFDAMAKDTAHFGDIAPEALAATAAYATKLGIEIQNLTGIMDQFDTFEGAAQSAGMLAEAFGMNIDAMDMMMSDNPAERIDQLRRAFQDTGKSVSDLSRHELKMLQQQMGGMDMESMKNALSLPVDEMGFDDFEAAMEESAEKVTPEEAMQNVAESVKKLSNALADLGSGPLSAMINGMMKAITLSEEYRTILDVLGKFGEKFFYFGMKIGNIMMEALGATGDLREMLESMLNFEGLDKIFATLETQVRAFFQLVKTDPIEAGKQLAENIIKGIQDYFGGAGGSAVQTGIQTLGANLIKAIEGFAPVVIKKFGEIVQGVADWISGGGIEQGIGDATQSGMGTAFSSALSAVFESLKEDLLPAVIDLGISLFDKAAPYLIGALTAVWAVILAKTVATGAISSVGMPMLKNGIKKFGESIGAITVEEADAPDSMVDQVKSNVQGMKEVIEELGDTAATSIKEAGKTMWEMVKSFLPPTIAFSAAFALLALGIQKLGIGVADAITTSIVMATALGSVYVMAKLAERLKEFDFMKMTKNLFKAAAFLLVGGIAFGGAIGLLNLAREKAGLSIMDTLTTLSILGLALTATLAFAGIVYIARAMVNESTVGQLIMGLVGAAGLLTGGGVLFIGALWALKKVYEATGISVTQTLEIMSSLGIALLATLGMAAVATIIGLAMSGPQAVLTFAGLAQASAFLAATVVLGAAIAYVVSETPDFSLAKFTDMMTAFGMAMVAVVGMVALGAGLVLIAPWLLPIGVALLAVSAFFIEAISSPIGLAGIFKAVDSIKITDPSTFEMKINAVGKILVAIQSLADVGVQIGKLSLVNRLLGGGTMEETIAKMESFMTGTLGSIKGIIQEIGKLAEGTSPAKAKAMESIAGVIGSIAQLAAVLVDPLTKIQEQSGLLSNLLGPSLQDRMTEMTEAMSLMFGTLSTNIKSIMTEMQEILKGITNPEAMAAQAEALGAVFEALIKVTETAGQLQQLGKDEATSWWINGSAGEGLDEIFNSVTGIIEPGGSLRNMMSTTIDFLNSMVVIDQSKVDGLKASVKSLIQFTSTLANVGSVIEQYQDQLNSTAKMLGGGIFGAFTRNFTPSQVAAIVSEEVVKIADSLKDMELDLQDIVMKPIAGGKLLASGKQEITVKPGQVHMTVNFTVKMDAEELAVTMHKGTENTNNEGFFVLTEAASKSEAFASDA
jgi:hypothetical protein